jgi:hypothetical protein
MADKKISQLTSASTPLTGTEELAIVQSGATVKATAQDIADLAPVPPAPSYREYFGILKVLGATPTVYELENTIGSPLTFSSVTTGEYILSFGVELFDNLKVYSNANGGVGGENNIAVYSGGPNAGKIRLLTYDQTNTPSNIGGNAVSIHIRVYP